MPNLQRPDDGYGEDKCLLWADSAQLRPPSRRSEQPKTRNYVVYVNNGTTGFNFFGTQMVHELTQGLEESKSRFL